MPFATSVCLSFDGREAVEADQYHWRDGIGPAESRMVRIQCAQVTIRILSAPTNSWAF